MENDYRLVRDLEEYVRFRAKKETGITLQLRDMISKMDDDELNIADNYYGQLLEADIRTLGNIGCIELAVKITERLYPIILREAYAELSKDRS